LLTNCSWISIVIYSEIARQHGFDHQKVIQWISNLTRSKEKAECAVNTVYHRQGAYIPVEAIEPTGG